MKCESVLAGAPVLCQNKAGRKTTIKQQLLLFIYFTLAIVSFFALYDSWVILKSGWRVESFLFIAMGILAIILIIRHLGKRK
ncbi:hypothetical protein [Rossellomorea marisflavi]|uniref:hypothetical protein n=1 Tax=Rossellomorea marisflavi TaxID=189381 RepID=UPI000A7AFEE9|nr:hypothetical protein [Rossellomorea marisflavi]